MKNLIISILAATTIYLTWKTYFSNQRHQEKTRPTTESNNNKERADLKDFKGATDEVMGIDIYSVVENYRNYTLTKLKDRDSVDMPRDRTDGEVTKSVTFNRDTLLRLVRASTSSDIKFIFGSLDRHSAAKYSYYRKKSKKSVVQKPIIILEVDTIAIGKDKPKKVYAIGKICPPPNNCP